MTFQQLSYLLEVAHTRSFSLAAKNLFVAQSTVSNAIAALEAELNCRIFIRSVQGLSLTTEGQQILAYAKRICENHQLLTSSVKADPLRLRVTSPEYPPARNAFLQILEEYRDRPDVQFSFGVSGNADIYDKLLLQQADVSIGIFFSQYDRHFMSIAATKKLLCQKLVTLPVGICIGQGHPLYREKDIKPEDLAGERFLDHPSKHISDTSTVLAYVPIDRENLLLCNNSSLRRDILKKVLHTPLCAYLPMSRRRKAFVTSPSPA